MIHSIVDRKSLAAEIKELIERNIYSGGEMVAYYVGHSERMQVDRYQMDRLREQVKDDLMDYFTDLMEELLDDLMEPGNFLEEFFDYTPPPESWYEIERRRRYDDDWGDFEYHRRRDEGLL